MAALEIHQCEAPAIVSISLLSGATDALLGAVLAERKPLCVGAASGFFYAREMNIAAANEFVRKLSEAKDIQSFWQTQADFMQTQWKTFSEQMKDLGETVTKSVTGAVKDIAA
jgi:hypothetical protein